MEIRDYNQQDVIEIYNKFNKIIWAGKLPPVTPWNGPEVRESEDYEEAYQKWRETNKKSIGVITHKVSDEYVPNALGKVVIRYPKGGKQAIPFLLILDSNYAYVPFEEAELESGAGTFEGVVIHEMCHIFISLNYEVPQQKLVEKHEGLHGDFFQRVVAEAQRILDTKEINIEIPISESSKYINKSVYYANK